MSLTLVFDINLDYYVYVSYGNILGIFRALWVRVISVPDRFKEISYHGQSINVLENGRLRILNNNNIKPTNYWHLFGKSGLD